MRQVVCWFKNVKDYIRGMFPYNDEENAWISKTQPQPQPYIEKTKDD